MAKEEFENSLRLTKIALLYSGIKIADTEYRKPIDHFMTHYLYYFNFIWLYTDVIAEIHWLVEAVLNGTSFIELSVTAPCVTISFVSTAKTVFLFLNRDIVIETISKLREIHPEDDDDDIASVNADLEGKDGSKSVEKEILGESVRFLRFVVLLLYYICAVVVVAFPLRPVAAMAYDYYSTGVTDCKYPYLVTYLFDACKAARWPAVYFHHVVSTIIVGANAFGSDSLFYVACIYTQMHFRLLCRRLQAAGRGAALRAAVERHQELIHLVDQVEILYSKSILFNILTSSFLICLSGFIITVSDDISVVLTFATFLFMNLAQTSLVSYFGDMLMRSSTEISSAVYNSLWYETDQRNKKCMLMILARAQKPCKLTACKFADLNLTAFTTILSRSWSYFALLRTMYN